MTYDEWRSSGPHDDMPDAQVLPTETCEHCGKPVAAINVSWCRHCLNYSDETKRREHEGRKGRR